MKDNCFTQIESFEAANRLSSEINPCIIDKILRQYIKTFIPAVEETLPDAYRWSIMQAEVSTDITFKDDSILPKIYEQLVSTAVHSVKVPDVATFLGYGMPRTKMDNFGSSLKNTIEGVRIKHNFGKHSVKMYDKYNRVLRIETTSNSINLFRTRRMVKHRDGNQSMDNASLPKSIYSLPKLFEIMYSSNRRYHEYISAIEDFSVGRKNLEKATAPATENNRNYKGINFFDEADGELLFAISSGEFNITGFRNKDLKGKLNQNTAKISRSLKRLRIHGLIKRIGKTYKYYLTRLGREVVTTGMKLKELYIIPRLNFTHS